MIATTVPGEPGDGTPEFVLTLARHMRSSDVTIVAPRVRGCARRQRVDGVALRRFAYAPRRTERLADEAILPALRQRPALLWQVPGLLLGLVMATIAECRRSRPDLVHAHWLLPGGVVALLVKRLLGRPYIVTAHGADAYALDGRFGRWLKRMVLREASGVYPVSNEIGDRLEALVPGCVTRVVPMGVDVDQLRQRVGTRAPAAGRLLFVGRLAEKKGVGVLLDALAELPETTTLRIAGDGPDRADLERRTAELGLGERVRFLGSCDSQQVAEEYRRAALVVLPSRTAADGDRDGTPVVLMEALALGVPVVASDLGGITDLLGDAMGDRLVPEGDAVALAQALRDALPVAETTNAGPGALVDDARYDVAVLGDALADDVDQLVRRFAVTT